MDWSNERYVRVYTRDTVTWQLLSWQAQGLLLCLLRKVDRAGVLDIGAHAPERAVAAVTGWPLEVVEAALPELLKAGPVEVSNGALVYPNYIAANEAKQSDAQRSRESRARRRDRARSQERGDIDTERDERTCPPVTPRDPDDTVNHDESPRTKAEPSRAVLTSRPPLPPAAARSSDWAVAELRERWNLRFLEIRSELKVVANPFRDMQCDPTGALELYDADTIVAVMEHAMRQASLYVETNGCEGTKPARMATMFRGQGFGAHHADWLKARAREKGRRMTPPHKLEERVLTGDEQRQWVLDADAGLEPEAELRKRWQALADESEVLADSMWGGA